MNIIGNDKKKYNSVNNNNIIVTTDDDMDYYACVNKNKNNKNNDLTEIIDNDSLKIVVKSANNIEDEIIPAILYPQPPRRTLPCLSTLLVTRNDEFINNSSPVVFPSHDDVDDAEEETLDDGSDSLLSASKLKYNNNKNNSINIEEDKLYFAKNHNEAYKKFNKISKSYHDNSSNNIVTNEAKKIQVKLNDNDKKKSVQRSMSHDYISNNNFIYDFNNENHKIFSRIKKFESLNSFDNTNFYINSNEKHDKSSTKQSNEIKKKIRRSESCHQVFNETKNDNLSNKGGSDSGLQYITDYNLQTVMINSKISDKNNKLSKSLDKIDETNITIMKNKKKCTRQFSEMNSTNNHYKKENYLIKKSTDYNNYNGHLKNDDIYIDKKTIDNQQKLQYKKHIISDNNMKNNLPIISSIGCDKTIKFSFTDTGGMYLPNTCRSHDKFNIGKNRFNAGKYSGDLLTTNNHGLSKNILSSNSSKRGKVTDIISGLY